MCMRYMCAYTMLSNGVCMPYMHALYVCLVCMPYMYALCLVCMRYICTYMLSYIESGACLSLCLSLAASLSRACRAREILNGARSAERHTTAPLRDAAQAGPRVPTDGVKGSVTGQKGAESE